MSYIRGMKLYNIRLPDELSYALKKAGADHVRQTLASSYGIECKTTRAKPVPPERKTTKERKTKDAPAERKTTKAVINKRKTGIPPEELRAIADGVATIQVGEYTLPSEPQEPINGGEFVGVVYDDPFEDPDAIVLADVPKVSPSKPVPSWKEKLEADRVRLAEESKRPKTKTFFGAVRVED